MISKAALPDPREPRNTLSLIDLHFHALPGLDDGPATMEESVALCRKAAEEGTTHMLREPANSGEAA